VEALNAVLPYLFQNGGLREIIADIEPRNAASICLLKKVGFQEYDFKERTMETGSE